MAVGEFLFLVIAVYLGYRFIFNFVLPIVRATHQVRQQFRDMQGSGHTGFGTSNDFDHSNSRPDANARPTSNARPASQTRSDSSTGNGSYKPPADEYIDFEEVK